MATQKWVLEIDGDSSGAVKATEAVSVKTIAMGNILADVAKGAAMALAAAIGTLTGELMKSVEMAAEAQKNQITLAAAMKQAGTYTDEAFQANLDYASALQKVSVYGDDQINIVQKLLTNFGLEGEALNAATKATLDLADAKTMDLSSAGDLVAKTIGTETNALKKYGVEADAAAGSTERVAQVVDGITKLFGGSAAAQTQTFSGKIKQLKEVYGDLYEEIGFTITNNKGLLEVFDILKGVIEDTTKYVSDHKEELAKLVKDGIIIVINSLSFLISAISYVSTAWTDLGNVILDITSKMITLWSWTNPVALAARAMGSDWIKALDGMKEATKEEIAEGSLAAEKRAAFLEDIKFKIDSISAKISSISTIYKPVEENVNGLINAQKNLVAETELTTADLLAIAKGYTQEELFNYMERRVGLKGLLEEGKISQQEYWNFIIEQGKKFHDDEGAQRTESLKSAAEAIKLADDLETERKKLYDEEDKKRMDKKKADVQAMNNTINQISSTAANQYLSGQKALGIALEDAAKASARAIIDAEIDKAIQSIGIAEALETSKALLGGFLSFGATLLLIPLIAAAGAAAKALIHSVVGFSGGGMVGEGGSKLPFPSFASSGSGAPALVMAHVGEAIGTPATLAAAGIGGMIVNVNISGGISSDLDADIIGERIGAAVQNKIRGTI